MQNKKFELKNTLGMFDLLKGIIMILVMVGHTYGLLEISGENTYADELLTQVNIIGLFLLIVSKIFAETAVPVFFIISGYSFRKTSYKKCIKKQFQTLIIPYIVSIAIATIVHFFSYLSLYGGIRYSFKQTVSLFLGGLLGLPDSIYFHDFKLTSCGPLWFLLSLAIANIIFNYCANHFEDNKLLIVSLIVSCIGWVISFAGPLPWSVSQGLVAVLYLSLGNYAKKHKILISKVTPKYSIILTYVAILVYLIFVGANSFFDMANSKYPLGPITIIAYGLLGIITVKLFLQLNRFDGPITTFIRKIGGLSLYVLCIHSIEMKAFGGYLQYMFVNDWWHGSLMGRNMIIIGIRIPFVLICTFIFKKIKDKSNKKQMVT